MSSSIKAALLANSSIAVAKGVGAFFTGSASMLAETIHSVADCGNQLLLMWGLKTAQKEADADHPLGYGKETYFWSFIVALVLFTLGGAYSMYEGIHKLHSTEPLQYVGWAAGILLFGFIMETRSLKVCISEIREQHPGKSLRWFFKETRSPELLVIFGEDIAALIGLGVAGLFLGIAAITGNPMWDAIGSIVVGTLLMIVAIFLFIETKALLIGQGVDPQVRRDLREFLVKIEEVEHTYECVTLQMGRECVLMLRVRMLERDDAQKMLADINRVEREIHEKFPQFTTIFLEPDNQIEDF